MRVVEFERARLRSVSLEFAPHEKRLLIQVKTEKLSASGPCTTSATDAGIGSVRAALAIRTSCEAAILKTW